jgi:outer membrane beta-barrel protein
MSTPKKKTLRRLVTGLVFALGLAAAGKEAQAQEILITGPLAGAPAVRQMRQYRKGRFEIAPTVSFTLLDEYRRTIFVGGRLQYNLTEWLGIGVWGAFGGVSLATDLTDQIDTTSLRNSRTATNVNHTIDASGNYHNASFADQTAKMQWVAAPQIQFTPFRGKLALFQKIFVDTDAYLHGGVAFIGLQERADCGTGSQPACSDPKSFALASRTASFVPTFGLGLNFYLSNLVSLGVEYRALPFSWNRAGFDSRGSGTNGQFPDGKIDSQDQTFKFNQMVTIALGFGLPTHPKISD